MVHPHHKGRDAWNSIAVLRPTEAVWLLASKQISTDDNADLWKALRELAFYTSFNSKQLDFQMQ